MLAKDGVEVLPITLLNGEVMKTKTYPTNEEFALWLGFKVVAKKTIKRPGAVVAGQAVAVRYFPVMNKNQACQVMDVSHRDCTIIR